MQLTIPDCCLGEFCPGTHVDGHRKKDDGTYYSTDDHESNAYHYHNTDGSVFYRYSDGSEYYRRKNGNITFRPPDEPLEQTEGADATLTPAMGGRDLSQPWYDWPPQLNLSVKTNGTSVTIREPTGLAVTFEPALPGPGVDLTPTYDRNTPFGDAPFDRSGSQASQGATFRVREWVKKQAMADMVSQGQE